ncbi:MAG: sulfatase [Bryobacteraceae bacterium]|nr:sulfatase [Bryobacteraceae bacterium]
MNLSRRAVLFGAPTLLLAQKTARERLNVLFIASDDLNNTLGCYGNRLVKTPHLNALAAKGVRFDRAYCQFPLCGPSRTSMLSGMRPDTTRIHGNQIAVRDTMPNVVTLPQLFRQNGWYSARFGKMYHMNVPGSVGTNNWDDPPSWDLAVSPPGTEDKTKGEGRNITPKYPSGNAMEWVNFSGVDTGQADASSAAQTLDLMAAKRGSPWFIGLGFLRPHVPFVAPSRFYDLYPLSSMPLAQNPANDRDDIPKASEITLTGRGDDMGMSEADKREALRGYYASVSYMDSLVGKVLSKVDLRKTAVVFWGDHGWHLGEHFRWQKRSLFEESARVPLIVAAPGRKGNGKAARGLVELVDVYPTLAELAGLKPPADTEGRSFAPLLDRPDRPWKSAAFTQVTGPGGIEGRAVRTDRWRYVRWTGPHPDEELYDEQADPREFTNLAHRDGYRERIAGLRKVLEGGWRSVPDPSR